MDNSKQLMDLLRDKTVHGICLEATFASKLAKDAQDILTSEGVEFVVGDFREDTAKSVITYRNRLMRFLDANAKSNLIFIALKPYLEPGFPLVQRMAAMAYKGSYTRIVFVCDNHHQYPAMVRERCAVWHPTEQESIII